MIDTETRFRWALALGLWLAPAAGWALHPLVTDDTGTQGRGRSQLEVNAELDRDSFGDHSHREVGMNGTFAFGVRDSLDVAWTVPYRMLWERSADEGQVQARGLSDAALEVKWRAARLGSWSLGLKPGLSLPSGDHERGLGSGEPALAVAALATREGERLDAHLNARYVLNRNTLGERTRLWHLSAAAVSKGFGPLRLAGNVYLENNPDPASEEAVAGFLGGVILSLGPDIDLDLGVKRALSEPENDLAFMAGTAFRF